ncbi:MAG: TolB family protein [Nocardioides sp.]
MKSRTAFIGPAALVIALSVIPTSTALAEETATRDGGLIVFTGETATDAQIWSVRPDGTQLLPITHVPGAAVNPDLSPDGRTITFEWALPSDAGARIAFVDTDGGNLRALPVTAGHCVDAQPSFTPDGQRVVYESFDCVSDDALFSRAVDGSDVQRITTPFPDGNTDPNVSPDGARLAFIRYDDGVEFQQALTTSDLDGGHQRDLVPPSFDVGIKTGWSPNGRRIVFTRDANPDPTTGILTANVATIGADGTHPRNLTSYGGGRLSAFAGSYSPDGRWIVFRLQDNQTGRSGLWKMCPDGTHRTLIFSRDGLRARNIDWGAAAVA